MKKTRTTALIPILVTLILFCNGCIQDVPLRGVYTIQLSANNNTSDTHSETYLNVVFIKPKGDTVRISGFYDGDDIFKFRAYCEDVGKWHWFTSSNTGELNNRRGSFRVVPSEFRGKLRINDSDPYQFMYDNGDWFLHIGETGYRYLVDTEDCWKEYIDQAAVMGATKIRCWFARSRHTVEALFNENRTGLDLAYWQEMEKRLDCFLIS